MDASWLIIIIFVALLLIKVPVPISVGVASVVGLVVGNIDSSLIVSNTVKTLNSFTLLAIPFFILAGNLMTRGSIAAKMLQVAKAFTGGKKEAIGIATIIACAFFAALSGSATATVAALGPLCIPMMTDEGYNVRYASAIVAAGSIVGPIIPPSILFCVYGVQTNTSISDLFMAGFIPGILLSVSMVIALQLTKKKDNNIDFEKKSMDDHGGKYTIAEKMQIVWDGKWALLMPIIVLGGIYSGIVTPSEAAVISCVYVLLVGFVIARDLSVKDMMDAFHATANTMGGLMILLGLSTVFGSVLTMNHIPEKLTELILGITNNPIFIMLGINAILLLAGCFMEAAACIVIFTPMLLPLAQQCGITSLQFGVILCVNLVIGTLTPPFGLGLFLTSSITKEPAFGIARKAIPFMISTITVLMVITYIPSIISFLPALLST